ncbi:hypothetical protein [Acuticoccus mangrovi]|uniref:Uncharacterized protein n=1 Tax=Acuticoccus mangrovi TaxID=2796142 RepID=A0A934IR02_9HYPH|nr:hypothetical protein [Acuticoccus mangrovi]MBJ3778502.1 hypothetical protein [Acuticoccus mangrovi]
MSTLAADRPTQGELDTIYSFVEQRFPLYLSPKIASINDLYEAAKQGRWNPFQEVPWKALTADGLDPETAAAVRRTYSRRAWGEATGLTETPALLIRFCMETGREVDPKFFLTVRNTEEVWAIECFDRVAEAFGGRIERPENRAYEAAFNQHRHRQVVSASQLLDAYVAVHCAFEDGLEYGLTKAWREGAADPILAGMFDKILPGKERHGTFGWLYLEHRAPTWSEEDKAAITEQLVRHVNDVEMLGLHCPWLAPERAEAEARADAITAEAGLGAVSKEAESEVLVGFVADARQRFAELGIDLPRFNSNHIGWF